MNNVIIPTNEADGIGRGKVSTVCSNAIRWKRSPAGEW